MTGVQTCALPISVETATLPLPLAPDTAPDGDRATLPLPGAAPADTSDRSTLPGAIGRFEVRGWLGSGAFGDVYRAYDPHLDREVALKVAKPGSLDTPERVGRFLREAKAAANLRHPNIVPLYETGRDADRLFIAAAFVPGRSLEAVVQDANDRGEPVPLDVAARTVRKLAEALAYAHSQGVVHRDVKPANVMVDDKGEPHLLDFGLAARAESGDERLTQDGQGMGTPAYMGPEQADGHGVAASDQYSLGCSLYELVTGRTPFAGGPAQQMFLHKTQTVPPPRKLRRNVPRDLDTVILRCLEKDPARRYANCGELAEDLMRFLAREPVKARRIGPVERLARWARRSPGLAGSLTAAGVALVAGTLVSVAFGIHARAEAARASKAEGEERARSGELGVALLEKTRAEQDASGKAATLARVNADLERTNDDLTGAFVRSLLNPLTAEGRDAAAARMSRHEMGVAWELASSRRTAVGNRFIADATATPHSCKQLATRADALTHAVVGLDLARCDRAASVLATRLGTQGLAEGHLVDLAVVAAQNERLPSAAAARAAATLVTALSHPGLSSDGDRLSHALAAVTRRMPPADAAAALAEALAAGTAHLAAGKTSLAGGLMVLADALADAAGRLEPDRAAAVREAAATSLAAAVGRASHVPLAEARALARLAVRLERGKAAALCCAAARVLNAERHWSRGRQLELGVAVPILELADRVGPADRLGILVEAVELAGGNDQHTARTNLAGHLLAAAGRVTLGEGELTGAASTVVNSVARLHQRMQANPYRRSAFLLTATELASALAVLAGGMERARAGEVCDDVAKKLLGVMEAIENEGKEAPPVNLAIAVAELADRMSPRNSREVCERASSVLARAVVKGKQPSGSPEAQASLARGLGRVAGRLGAERAAEVCAPAFAALARSTLARTYDQEAPRLAAGLASLAEWLPPGSCDAVADHFAAQVKRATAKANPAFSVAYFAEALELVAGVAGPGHAAELCESATATLIELMSETTHGHQLARLTESYTELSRHAGPLAAPRLHAKAADALLACAGKAKDAFSLAVCVKCLSVVASRLEAGHAAAVCDRSTAALRSALDQATTGEAVSHLLDGLQAVTGLLPADRAARVWDEVSDARAMALARALDSEFRTALTREAMLGLDDAPAATPERRTDRLWRGSSGVPYPNLPRAATDLRSGAQSAALAVGGFALTAGLPSPVQLGHPYFYPRPRPLPSQALVEVLKHPFCTGGTRRAALDALQLTYGRAFPDQWAFVEFARDRNLPLDLLTPPVRRPAKP